MEKERNSAVELWRLVAITLIMIHHMYCLGFDNTSMPFYMGVFVESFFMLTGYFTMKHFDRHPAEDICSASFSYTFHKFKAFLPYTIPAILIQYLIVNRHMFHDGILTYLGGFNNMLLEMLYLTATFRDYESSEMIPLWFLSAMFLVFPMFCCVLQMRKSRAYLFLAWLFPVFYYGFAGVRMENTWFPYGLLRAFAAMLMGVLIYAASEWLKNRKNPDIGGVIGKLLLTAVEVGSLLLTVFFSFVNYQSLEMYIICYMIGLTIMLSGKSYTGNIHSPVLGWLGKFTMPVFVWHWVVGTAISQFLPLISIPMRILLYFAGTVLVSAISYGLVEGVKRIRKNMASSKVVQV